MTVIISTNKDTKYKYGNLAVKS